MTGHPPPALAHWKEIARRIRSAGQHALLTDFDGSLAEIREDPARVRLPRRARAALRALCRRGVLTGIVSGRSLLDVEMRVGLPQLWYAGSHGLALAGPRGGREFLATPAQVRRMDTLATRLEELFRGQPGIQVERKDCCLAVHYRRAGRRERIHCHRTVALALAGSGDVRRQVALRRGRCVWEIMPRVGHSKWTAIQSILRQSGFGPAGMVIYLGDDLADEDVFQRMRRARKGRLSAIPILVGRPRHSSARYRLRTVREAAILLEKISEALP